MKTAIQRTNEFFSLFSNRVGMNQKLSSKLKEWLESEFTEHDKELTAKIKELREEATNFQVIGVLDKIIKMIGE